MNDVSADIVIDAPADAVWQVVAHQFDQIGEWATSIQSSTAIDAPINVPIDAAPSSVGAPVDGRVCRTGLRVAPAVTETIVEFDAAGRSLTYEATDGMPGFVAMARNRWQVTAISASQSRAAFHATVRVRGLLGRLAWWWLLTRVLRDGKHLLHDLKHYVEQGTPSPRKYRQLIRTGQIATDPVAAIGIWPSTGRLRSWPPTALRLPPRCVGARRPVRHCLPVAVPAGTEPDLPRLAPAAAN